MKCNYINDCVYDNDILIYNRWFQHITLRSKHLQTLSKRNCVYLPPLNNISPFIRFMVLTWRSTCDWSILDTTNLKFQTHISIIFCRNQHLWFFQVDCTLLILLFSAHGTTSSYVLYTLILHSVFICSRLCHQYFILICFDLCLFYHIIFSNIFSNIVSFLLLIVTG